jgi:hypothetical protein
MTCSNCKRVFNPELIKHTLPNPKSWCWWCLQGLGPKKKEK